MPPNKKIEVQPKAIKKQQGQAPPRQEPQKPKRNEYVTLHSTIDDAGAEENTILNGVTNPDDYE